MRTLIVGAAVLGLASLASAGQRDRFAGDRAHLLHLAHEVEEIAASVHHTAEGTAHHPSRGERQALRRLHELNKEARHFHRQAERYRPSSRHLGTDFSKLARRFCRAQDAMHHLHALRGGAALVSCRVLTEMTPAGLPRRTAASGQADVRESFACA